MRVGVIGPLQSDSFADNVLSSLNRMGHEGISLGGTIPSHRPAIRRAATIARSLPRFDEKMQGGVARVAEKIRPDVVISLEGTLHPSIVEQLRRHSPVVLWFPDAVANLGRHYPLLAPYTALFFKDPWVVERLEAFHRTPVHYLPEACNPAWHQPTGSRVDNRETIVVAGNLYPLRAEILSRLVERGFTIRLYGPPPPPWCRPELSSAIYTGHYLARKEKAAVFRSAGAVLNTLHPAEIHGMNCRLFEATACGAVVVTERRQELPNLFEENRHLLGYDNFEELCAQLTDALAKPKKAMVMGDAATVHAHAHHTYEHRLNRLFDLCAP